MTYAEINAAIHALVTDDKPCTNACTHVIVGQWTALGLAHVMARVEAGATT